MIWLEILAGTFILGCFAVVFLAWLMKVTDL